MSLKVAVIFVEGILFSWECPFEAAQRDGLSFPCFFHLIRVTSNKGENQTSF